MPERYIAFDVETPNSANSRMSAIGVAVVEGGEVVGEYSTLVNPETHFDPFNIQLTGITPEQAAQAPTFRELWPMLEPVFSGGILAAHNAPFDMAVLSKCLRAYGIRWRALADYVCTCQIGRRSCLGMPNYRLDTLCRRFDIPLDHHRAGSDSMACAQLLLRYREMGVDPLRFRRRYDLLHARTLGGSAYC